MIDELLMFVGELGDPEARNVAERVFLRAIERIWLQHPWLDFESPAPYSITLVPNQRSYALPDWVGRLAPRRDVRNLTKGATLRQISIEDLEHCYPESGTALEIAGTPCHYALGGVSGVARQPSPLGQALEVLSSSAADISVLVTVGGIFADWIETTVQLQGLTPVAVGLWTQVDTFGKAMITGIAPATELTSSVGIVTLRTVIGASPLEVLYPFESAKEHRLLTFAPKPSAADVMAVPYIRRIKKLIHDSDPVPADWGPALFEEMVIQWRVNTGEVSVDSTVSRPNLLDLIAHDNRQRAQLRTKPWGGWR